MSIDDESRYERARAVLPGLLGDGRARERFLAGLLVASLFYVAVSSWRASGQLAECKQEKQQGFVVVINGKGEQIEADVVGAAEWKLADGMVVERLVRTVRCLRGMDPNPKVVSDCWKEQSPLFSGSEAVNKFDDFQKSRIPTVDAILQWQQREEIIVNVESYDKPFASAPNRFWLKWTEKHVVKSGQSFTETWSGTFDVELTPIEKRSGRGMGMRIVRWDWHCDLGGCKGKGAG